MAQTQYGLAFEFIAFGQKLGRKQKGSALRHLPSLRRSCRRSGRSPALPYPPHEYLQSTISPYSVPGLGDISTLQNRGHFYFALTVSSWEDTISTKSGVTAIMIWLNSD